MSSTEGVTLRSILEECRDGRNGGAFNEVVVMLESTAASAEVYMDLAAVRVALVRRQSGANRRGRSIGHCPSGPGSAQSRPNPGPIPTQSRPGAADRVDRDRQFSNV